MAAESVGLTNGWNRRPERRKGIVSGIVAASERAFELTARRTTVVLAPRCPASAVRFRVESSKRRHPPWMEGAVFLHDAWQQNAGPSQSEPPDYLLRRAAIKPLKQITTCESQPHASTRVYRERIVTGEGKGGQPWAVWTCQQDSRKPWCSVPRARRPRSGGSRGLPTRGGAQCRRGRLRKRSDLHSGERAGATTRARRPWTRSRPRGLSQNHLRLSSRRAGGQRRRGGPNPTYNR